MHTETSPNQALPPIRRGEACLALGGRLLLGRATQGSPLRTLHWTLPPRGGGWWGVPIRRGEACLALGGRLLLGRATQASPLRTLSPRGGGWWGVPIADDPARSWLG